MKARLEAWARRELRLGLVVLAVLAFIPWGMHLLLGTALVYNLGKQILHAVRQRNESSGERLSGAG